MHMKKLLPVLCLVVSFLIGSCSSNDTSHRELSRDINLELVDEIRIELDSLTGFFSYDIQMVNLRNGETNIALLNHLVQRIQVYDYETGRHVESYDFDVVGPDGVGGKPRAFHIVNKDSIFIFDSWTARVSLINSSGEKKDHYDLISNGVNEGFAFPQGSTQRPIKFIDGKLYMAGLLLPWEGVELNENQFVRYDPQTDSLDYIVTRPDLYNQHNWGNNVMFHLNYDYNPTKKEFIFSFNSYDHLMVSDIDGNDLRYFPTPSRHFDEIEPYEEKFSYSWNEQKLKDYSFQNPRYWSVMYDRFKDVTYRFALRPNSRQDFQSGIRNMQVSLIILDSDYNKIGEYDFDRAKYDSRMSFISEKGIHFANKEKFEMNEEAIVFDVFNIKR